MAEVLLFHHGLGLTPGVHALADELRAAGHTVHTPDLYEGRTFTDLDDGVAHLQRIGFGEIIDRGVRAADQLPPDLVYAGISLGVLPAQRLAQTRTGARGALLFESCVPASEFGTWPDDVAVQIHAMADDPWFAEDHEAAREIATSAPQAELFLYPGEEHLFTDASLPSYDEAATALLLDRVRTFLAAR